MDGMAFLRGCLPTRPLVGAEMVVAVTVALAAPTLLRASVDGAVQGVAFTPYLPFVVVAAFMLDWRAAAVVACASALVGDLLFEGTRYKVLETPTDLFGILAFGAASAVVIGVANTVRKFIADPLWLNGPTPTSKGVVFSLERGQAFVSWYGGKAFVPLGAEDDVAKMMRDFLAQQEVGRQLSRRS